MPALQGAPSELFDRDQGRRDRRHHHAAGLPHARAGRLRSAPNRSRTGSASCCTRSSRFHSFLWASGGCYSDFYIHNIDECCWMKDAWPVAGPGPRRPALPRRQRRPELRQLLGRVHLRRRHQAVPRRPQHGRLLRRVRQLRPRHQGLGRHLRPRAHARPSAASTSGQNIGDAEHRLGFPSPSRTPTSSNGTT